jgi:hypothetical protein
MNLRQRGHGGDVVLVVGFAFQDERAARGEVSLLHRRPAVMRAPDVPGEYAVLREARMRGGHNPRVAVDHEDQSAVPWNHLRGNRPSASGTRSDLASSGARYSLSARQPETGGAATGGNAAS